MRALFCTSRGESFAVTDSRAAPPESQRCSSSRREAEVRFGGFDEALLDGCHAQSIASPGVSLRRAVPDEAAHRGMPIIGDIELFAREAQAPVAAITGTNGKSTVTTLVARMAEAAGKRALAGGNLGRPALDLLDEPAPELYVLELSSFQLDTTQSLRAAAAVVLNVTPDHMDRYATCREYAAAKARIFERCEAAVINLDDPLVRAMRMRAPRSARASVCKPIAARITTRTAQGDDVALDARRAQLLLDVRAEDRRPAQRGQCAGGAGDVRSAAACRWTPCVQALREFPGLPHRSQWVADVRGVRYVDDSKGTNVGATLAAVAGMSGSLVLIAGGQGKGQDFAPLAAAFRGKVRHVVLIGQDAKLLAAALEGVCEYRARARHGRRRAARLRVLPVPARRCCSRPRARVSTCFATTRIAAMCSRRPCGGSTHERRGTRLRPLERPPAALRVRSLSCC